MVGRLQHISAVVKFHHLNRSSEEAWRPVILGWAL